MSLQPMSHDLYSTEEAAIRLHLSVPTIRELIKSGQLRASLVGRSYLITRSAIDDFIEARAGVRKEKNTNHIVYEKRGSRAVRVA
jgi:excisionase family DNA binding protein